MAAQRSAPPPSASSVLFSPLGATDPTSAVVHRLRAAIALGLLPEGCRLPREADLATQLSITTFALREALAELRQQRLLITRAGKNGGSFVAPGAAGAEVERAELLSVSTVELRDLADWRKMLAGRAAALAAMRVSPDHLDHLHEFAERVAQAGTSRDARRANGRFHLELAAAAQSHRLAQAQFTMHEELDWLFGLALSTPQERRTCADLLCRIIDCLRVRDHEGAREAAQLQIQSLVDRLSLVRIEAVAQQQSRRPRTSLPAQLRGDVKRVLAPLAAMASEAAAALTDDVPFEQLRRRLAVATLQRSENLPAFVAGAGVIAEVGVVPGHPYWIQWASRTDTGPVEDHQHVLDPQAENFYDYESMEYMRVPRETHEPVVSGPYVDYGGIDAYVLTFASPILAGDRFLGCCCADVRISDFESWLAPWLAARAEMCLTNSSGRVIVSNGLWHSVGSVVVDKRGYAVDDSLPFGWSLLTRPRP